MAEDRDDDAPDYRGLDTDAALYRQADEEGHIFDDGRTLTSVDDSTANDGHPKSLMDLQHGINGATAQQMILEQVYQMAVLCNFILVRLNASSGAKHPRQFSESTRAFIEDKPTFQVRTATGAPAPYVYHATQETTDLDDDMRIPQ